MNHYHRRVLFDNVEMFFSVKRIGEHKQSLLHDNTLVRLVRVNEKDGMVPNLFLLTDGVLYTILKTVQCPNTTLEAVAAKQICHTIDTLSGLYR